MNDILSSTLMTMRFHSFVSGTTNAAGRWGLDVPEYDALKLYMVLKGEGWIVLEKTQAKYFLRPGDSLLVLSSEPLVASSDLAVTKRLTIADVKKSQKDGVFTINGGGESLTTAIFFQFEGHMPELIFKGLPPAIHIPAHAEESANLRWNVERFRAEYLGQSIGYELILNHLAPIILVQILRTYLRSTTSAHNWLTSLSHPKLSRVIEAIHTDYGKPWSLRSLADVAGMSRAGFALTFKKKVGVSPGEYLTNWRMQVARQLLRDGDRSIYSIAGEVGYDSESAFSTAFTKIVGRRPGLYRKAAQTH